MTKKILLLAALCATIGINGCSSLGAQRLRADQVDYARALGDATKREILSAVVGLRYADTPGFLNVSQIIAAYSFDASASALVTAGQSSLNYARANANSTLSYSNHPTFTFTPTTGEAYATAFIRPLPPTLFLPLADSGTPIDLLLRLTAQSIGGLQNGSSLGGPNGNGSPQFFDLLHVLRRLQLAGELTVASGEVDHGGGVSITLGATPSGESPQTTQDLATVRRLLRLSDKTKTYQVIYGQTLDRGDTIPMVPRSVLSILSNLGAQVDVPAADVKRGATMPTVTLVGGETRPTVIVHSGAKAPADDTYVEITYRGTAYWVLQSDFDSKYALTIVQNLMALAQSNQDVKTPIITVPAS
ncbi:MAG: hypothetical protein ACRYHA_29475 [Janthinobacterium lividum]